MRRRLTVKHPRTGFSQDLEWLPSDTGAWLKNELARTTAIDAQDISLFLFGKEVEDTDRLSSLNILVNGTQLFMVIPPEFDSRLPVCVRGKSAGVVERNDNSPLDIPLTLRVQETPIAISKWGESMGFIAETGALYVATLLLNQPLTPIVVSGVDQVFQMHISEYLKLVLDRNGNLYSWGWNQHGQLGLSHFCTQTKPTAIPKIPQMKSISCGFGHCAAVDHSQQLWTWGDNGSGQCGNDDGEERYAKPTKLSSAIDVLQIDCGYEFTAFLDQSRHVFTFGANTKGQLGLGDTFSRFSPEQVPNLEHIEMISAGAEFMIAVSDNLFYGWGNSSRAQLGIPSAPKGTVLSPVQGTLRERIHAVSAATTHALFLDVQGFVWLCGEDHGDDLGAEVSVPTIIASQIVFAAAGQRGALMIKSDETIRVWGKAQMPASLPFNLAVPVQSRSSLTKRAQ